MSVDGQSIAGVKNRVGKSNLTMELYRIDRQKKAEMRMHNTLKQRFRARYSKLDIIDEASDVRPYETHTPGFCYRRNGECRIPQVPPRNPSVDFDDIHCLLFTDGEVDIDKVLCLHLLTAHRTETLTPPARSHRALSFLAKEQLPLERLIERSRKKRHDDSLTKLLPTYVLDVKTKKPGEDTTKKNDVVIRDGRLAARVIINDKIVQLVHTVMSALHSTNPDKINKLLTMSKDPEIIKQVIEKPHIKEFLDTLSGQQLVSSCDSFHLTQPFKSTTIPLELETASNGLEKLVNDIRKNVLRLPSQSMWKNMYTKSQTRDADLTESVTECNEMSKKKTKDACAISSKELKVDNNNVPPSKKNFIDKNRESTSKQRNSSLLPNTARTSKTNNLKTTDSKNPKLNLPNYLKFLNKETLKKTLTKKEEIGTKVVNPFRIDLERTDSEVSVPEKEELIKHRTDIFKMIDINNMSSMIRKKAIEAHKRDLAQLSEHVETPTKPPEAPVQIDTNPVKVSIKQLTCSACIEKWKVPLPKPKTPNIKKVSIPTLDQSTYNELQTRSFQKLSMMIDDEMNKLTDEAKRSSRTDKNKMPSNRTYKTMAKGVSKRQSVDTVELDVFDLAKITQEIREKETQRKLSKFLENKI